MFATLLTPHDRTHPHTACPTLPQLEHWTTDLVAASPCLHPSRRAVFLSSHALALAVRLSTLLSVPMPFGRPSLAKCPVVPQPKQKIEPTPTAMMRIGGKYVSEQIQRIKKTRLALKKSTGSNHATEMQKKGNESANRGRQC